MSIKRLSINLQQKFCHFEQTNWRETHKCRASFPCRKRAIQCGPSKKHGPSETFLHLIVLHEYVWCSCTYQYIMVLNITSNHPERKSYITSIKIRAFPTMAPLSLFNILLCPIWVSNSMTAGQPLNRKEVHLELRLKISMSMTIAHLPKIPLKNLQPQYSSQIGRLELFYWACLSRVLFSPWVRILYPLHCTVTMSEPIMVCHNSYKHQLLKFDLDGNMCL